MKKKVALLAFVSLLLFSALFGAQFVEAKSWSTTEVVSTESTGISALPSLAVDSSGNVHVAWEDWTDYAGSGTDIDIFYKRYEVGTSQTPSLAVDSGGNVHVAWQDWSDYAGSGGTDWDIFYKNRTSSWSTTEVVSTESTKTSGSPSLAVDSSDRLHVAWTDYTDYAGSGTDWDIFYNGTSQTPSLAVDSGGNVHVAWQDWSDYAGSGGTDWDIFYKSRTSSWSTTEVVSTESTGWSVFPSLAVDSSGNVHVAWEDDTDYAGSGTDRDIFYKSRTSSWSTTEVVSTESTKTSVSPSLAVDSSDRLHVAWDDLTDYAGAGTDRDIFYKSRTSSWSTTELLILLTGYT